MCLPYLSLAIVNCDLFSCDNIILLIIVRKCHPAELHASVNKKGWFADKIIKVFYYLLSLIIETGHMQ